MSSLTIVVTFELSPLFQLTLSMEIGSGCLDFYFFQAVTTLTISYHVFYNSHYHVFYNSPFNIRLDVINNWDGSQWKW